MFISDRVEFGNYMSALVQRHSKSLTLLDNRVVDSHDILRFDETGCILRIRPCPPLYNELTIFKAVSRFRIPIKASRTGSSS